MKFPHIEPEDVRVKLKEDGSLLIDLSQEYSEGEDVEVDIPEYLYDKYRDEDGNVDLQEVWSEFYNILVDVINGGTFDE